MQVGDVVDIYNQTPSGKEVLEGKAKLRRHWSTEQSMEYWEVQFVSDGFVADRWIKKTAHHKNKEALDSFFAKNI